MTPPQVIKYLRRVLPNGPWQIIIDRRGKVVTSRVFGPASESACKRFIARWHSREDEGFLTLIDLGRADEEAMARGISIAAEHGTIYATAISEEEIAKVREVVQ